MAAGDAAHEFRCVAIVGLGLIGGSLALALRRLPDPPRIVATSADSADLERALADGIVDSAAADPASAVGEADLVVYATPVSVTLELLASTRSRIRDGAVVTDVGSVKRSVVSRARAVGLGARFVGGHPLAGSHRSGFAAARADLYDGARVWLTPPEGGRTQDGEETRALEHVAALWRSVGAEPAVIGAEEHDRLMAWASHLPQLAASALATALARGGIAPADLGPGGADTTRIAASPPSLWADILRHNADYLRRPLESLQGALAHFAAALERGDREALERLLAVASAWRSEE